MTAELLMKTTSSVKPRLVTMMHGRELMHYYAPKLSCIPWGTDSSFDVVDKLVMETIFAAWRHVNDAPQNGQFAGWLRRVGAN